MSNLERFRDRPCKRCGGTCFHRSRYVASGRHFARRGSQKSKETK